MLQERKLWFKNSLHVRKGQSLLEDSDSPLCLSLYSPKKCLDEVFSEVRCATPPPRFYLSLTEGLRLFNIGVRARV